MKLDKSDLNVNYYFPIVKNIREVNDQKVIVYYFSKIGRCKIKSKDVLNWVRMGDVKNVELYKINRIDCPIILNPNKATFDDVGLHAYFRQRLSWSTIYKNLRYARFMERHVVSVNFRNPSYENFVHHMDYREQIENATSDALKHEWKAMKMFLNAYGVDLSKWPYKPPSSPRVRKRLLPYPQKVNEFFTYNYSKDNFENALYRYLFVHSFLIGWRVPSEICNMTIDDVVIDDNFGQIVITETKKHLSKRTIMPSKALLSSKVHCSFKNWIDYWRPKVENRYSGDALYLWPNGKPVSVRRLGHKLSEYGKLIWPYFRPYDMRHWCAVARLIRSKVNTGNFDCYSIKNWLGHDTITTTESYIRYAEQFYNQLPVDWISCALKPSVLARKHIEKENKDKINRMPFLGLLNDFSSVEDNGLEEI